jgi:hypothetical protein
MPSATSLFAAPLVIFGVFSAGCSQPIVDDVADAAGAQTQGIVTIDRLVAADGSTQTHVSAKFLRLGASADPDVAERVVGSRLDLPALGECRLSMAGQPQDDAASLPSIGSIELLDVGDVTIQGGDLSLPLAARAFPDIADLVSGVFYTSRDASTDLPAPAHYRLDSTGSASVERFDLSLEAPAAPEDIRLGEEALEQGPSIDTTAPVALRWRAGQAEDVIYVDLTTASTPSSIRCAFTDVGHGSIPGSMIDDAFGSAPAVGVALHRLRSTGFSMPGIDGGEARFDLAVAGQATLAHAQKP